MASARVEYLGFQNVPDHREYRLAICGPDGRAELRFRIATAAFGAGRLRLQDGPDVCYQKLLRELGAGEAASPDVVTIDDAELAAYREAHTPAPKHRSPSASPKPPFVPRVSPRPRSPLLPVAPLATSAVEPTIDEGQRVKHETFGAGVTTSSTGGYTTIRFDAEGLRTFVTSMLKLEVLSGPHTWETGPRGNNRPRETALLAP
jgi:hypothetical protein